MLTPTKTDARILHDLLESGEGTLEEIALEVMKLAWKKYEANAKWAVVGQLYYVDGQFLTPEDPAADKVCLGLFKTQTQATTAAKSLVYGSSTHEQARVWVLPVHNGTPASFYDERRKKEKVLLDKRAEPPYTPCHDLWIKADGLTVCTLQKGHDGEHGTMTEEEA